jgi:histone H3
MSQLIDDFDSNDYDYKDENYRLKESIVIDFEATKANLGSEGIDMINKLQDEMDNDLDDEANDDIEYFKEHIEKSIELLEELEDTHKLLYAFGYKSMFHTLDQQGKDWINKIHELCESDETDCDELESLLETIDLYIDRFENYEDDQVQVIFELSNAVKNFEEFLEDIVILQNYSDITEIPQYEFYKSLLESAQEIIEEEGDSGEYTTLPDFKATVLKNLREAADALGEVNRKSKKRRIEYKSIEEIRAQQQCTGLIIDEENFRRLVAEVAQDYKTDLAFEVDALEAIQTAAEDYLVGLFEDTNIDCIHARRDRIHPNDMSCARRVRGEWG